MFETTGFYRFLKFLRWTFVLLVVSQYIRNVVCRKL